MADAKAMINNGGKAVVTFTDARTGLCNSNNEYVIRNGDIEWESIGVERQDNTVTITFERDIVPDRDYELTIAATNGKYESQRSAAVSLQFSQGEFESAPTRSRKHVSKF